MSRLGRRPLSSAGKKFQKLHPAPPPHFARSRSPPAVGHPRNTGTSIHPCTLTSHSLTKGRHPLSRRRRIASRDDRGGLPERSCLSAGSPPVGASRQDGSSGPSTLPDSVAEFNKKILYPHSLIRSRILKFLLGAPPQATPLPLSLSPFLPLFFPQVAEKPYCTNVHNLLYSPTQTAL